MNKINIPQYMFSYAGGSGGEWLAYQMGNHAELFQYHEGELEGSDNDYNRWRITPSWRAKMLDDTDWKSDCWLEEEYDGSDEWWTQYNNNLKNVDSYLEQAQELIETGKRRYSIPVHRCHEAWQDSMWSPLFNSFNTVTIRVNPDDSEAWTQFQGNIIRKIFWQDLTNPEDLHDEMSDKCRKLSVDYAQARKLIDQWQRPVNYTDMMLSIACIQSQDPVEHTLNMLSDRWNDYNVLQHHKTIPGNHYVVDFGDMFVRKQYNAYVELCEFMKVTAMPHSEWSLIMNGYTSTDESNLITVEKLKERLCQRISEVI